MLTCAWSKSVPDISMCQGTGCERSDTCFRAQATPNPYRQSYFARPPMDDSGDCKHYWPLEDARILKEKGEPHV